MVNTTASEIVETARSDFYTVAIAFVILLIGLGIGILAKKLLKKVLKKIELNAIMGKAGITADVEATLSSMVSYLIYLITIVLFLDQLELASTVLYIIIGAALMLLILTLLVGLKDVLPNFVAWIIIQKRGKIKEGYRIEIKEISGRVEHIGYLETEIKTDNEDILYVPNNLFIKSKLRLRK
ncbi:MAG TPA: mechanosensitive ion channel domain-containing protein [Candidatus Nanoarchaeia archaeon]|nr:mechanosensitive ion channel domain-containing protein [Candidatus Nanoarchaeia archaeon]